MYKPINKVEKQASASLKESLWVLHICHCHYPPFLDVARQYNSLFTGTQYKTLTVYITGQASEEVRNKTCSDEVIFLEFHSSQVAGLKLAAIKKIKEIISTRSFVFCITHRTKPTYIALLASTLPVMSVHHNYGDFKRLSRRIFFNFFKKRLLLIGVSNSVRDEMRSIFSKWPTSHIETLYNRVDVNSIKQALISRVDARKLLGIPDNAWVVACVARLHPIKDHVTLIKGFSMALPQLSSNSILVIMGSGEMESALKLLVKALNIEDKVIFTGFKEDARQYFKAFDLFVLASKKEAFGMVFIEAMSAGLHILSSKNGGGVEVVDSVAETFNIGGIEELAEKLVKINKYRDMGISELSNKKLEDCFSDEAVRKVFWNLPFVKDFFPKTD